MAQRVGRSTALLFMTTALEGDEWSAARPGRTLTPGKTRYSLYRRLGGLQGRSGRAANLAPPGFDPRNIQPVAGTIISHHQTATNRNANKLWPKHVASFLLIVCCAD